MTVAIFAGWVVITRFSVTHELRAWDITALRFGIGAIILLPTLIAGPKLPSGAWRDGLLFSALWGAPFVLLVARGIQLTSAAQGAAIPPTLMPVFAGLIGWFGFRHPQGWKRLLGYGGILSGLIGLVLAGSASDRPPDFGGIIFLTLPAAMWAIYTVLFRRSGLSAVQSAALISLWSALLFLPVYFLFDLSRLSRAPFQEIALQCVYQGILMSAVAIVSFNRAVASLGAGAATAILALVPAVAALMAIPVLGEIPTIASIFATLAIIAGVMLAAAPASETAESTSSASRQNSS